MPRVARITDMWTGICCCHAGCIAMTGRVITGNPIHESGNLKVARLTDMVIGDCGHPGKIVTGAPKHNSTALSVARITDLVTGCTIGKIVTGNPVHESGTGTAASVSPVAIVQFQGEEIKYTEVDFGNSDDDPVIDDSLNIYPPVIGRAPTAEEITRSEALDVSPTVDVEDSTTTTHITDATAEVGCTTIDPSLPNSFPLSTNFTLGDLSTKAVLSKSQVRDQHGYTAQDMVCNLQGWAENIGEPLSTQFGRTNFIITSGFRAGSSTSQHERGMAADLQYPLKTNTEVYNIAVWIRDNLPFDQLILEYGGNRPWIHVSFNRFGNRPSTASNKFGTRVSPGNYVWGVLKNMI